MSSAAPDDNGGSMKYKRKRHTHMDPRGEMKQLADKIGELAQGYTQEEKEAGLAKYWFMFTTFEWLCKKGLEPEVATFMVRTRLDEFLKSQGKNPLTATFDPMPKKIPRTRSDRFLHWLLLDEYGNAPTTEDIMRL